MIAHGMKQKANPTQPAYKNELLEFDRYLSQYIVG